MPAVSEKQRRAMWAAAEGHSTLGIPEKVGKEFVEADSAEPSSELDMAKAIRDGRLSSPQRYENLHLFDVRITGTGTAYRQALDEYVYRPPENFLTEDFVERCNGLPLIFEHPVDSILTTDEFRQRAVGTIILPYIKGEEVWGIAKVYDDDAAQLMRTSHPSTSPAVVFRARDGNETIELDDGKTLLVEGRPSYLDHLAICEEGVWDKGGQSKGIRNQEDSAMADEEMVPAWADSLGKRLDAIHSRLDALEEHRKDSFEGLEKKVEGEGYDKEAAEKIAGKVAAEKRAKHDSKEEAEEAGEREEEHEHEAEKQLKLAEKEGEEEKREEREDRKDSKRKDSDDREDCRMDKARRDSEKRMDSQKRESDELRRQVASLNSKLDLMTKPTTPEDREALARAHARADALARMFGDSVTGPLAGETPIQYRKRCAAKFQKHSESAKSINLESLGADAFALVENQIYADAQAGVRRVAGAGTGRLIEMRESDGSGRTITRYEGDPREAWKPFIDAGRSIAAFNTFRSA